MKTYNLKSIKVEDYGMLDKYYRMRRPQTADSNLLDLFYNGKRSYVGGKK